MSKNISIIETFKIVSRRPGLYIGGKSITKLFFFLCGAEYAARESDPEWSDPVYDGFQEWIQRRFDVETSQDWANIILFHSTDESNALEFSLKLLEEYVSEYEKN